MKLSPTSFESIAVELAEDLTLEKLCELCERNDQNFF